MELAFLRREGRAKADDGQQASLIGTAACVDKNTFLETLDTCNYSHVAMQCKEVVEELE